jgi:hypothetical protein
MAEELSVHLDHNVYILGAGFSRDAGLPIMGDFLQRMRESAEFFRQTNNVQFEDVIAVLRFRQKAAAAAYRIELDLENIEDLFSLLSAEELESSASYMPRAIASTIEHCCAVASVANCRVRIDEDVLKPLSSWVLEPGYVSGVYKVPLYHVYAGVISGALCEKGSDSRSSVITFNYDTVLEDALREIEVPFRYGLPKSMAVYDDHARWISDAEDGQNGLAIFKLHGSVNWSSLTAAAAGGQLKVFQRYSEISEGNALPLLIPPTWRKQFEGRQFSRIWGCALRAIAEATRIIVIGFSMPASDGHFKYLLAAGLQQNISLREIIFINLPGAVGNLKANVAKIFTPKLINSGVISYYSEEGALRTLLGNPEAVEKTIGRRPRFIVQATA